MGRHLLVVQRFRTRHILIQGKGKGYYLVLYLTQRKILTFSGLPEYDGVILKTSFGLTPSHSCKTSVDVSRFFRRGNRESQSRFAVQGGVPLGTQEGSQVSSPSWGIRGGCSLCDPLLPLQKFCCIFRCVAGCETGRMYACIQAECYAACRSNAPRIFSARNQKGTFE